MSHRRMITGHLAIAGALLALATPLAAAEPQLPAAARAWVEDMRKTCAGFENGQLSIDWERFVARADVTGDGKPDTILHATPEAVRCTSMASMNCGTAGCGLMVVVDGGKPHEFIAQSWDVGRLGDGRGLLVIGVHWSSCNYQPQCRSLLAWSPEKKKFEEIGLIWRHVPAQE